MQYKNYGKTGKSISVIGFGGMRFPEDEDYGVEMVRYANKMGINYFDTAPGYCDDRSEFIMGRAFQSMPGEFFVSTKSSANSDPTADDVRRRIEESLRRLNVSKINFYNMWCILDLDKYEKVISKGGPLEGAMKAKEEGLLEHVCFTTHAKGEEIAKIIEDGYFEAVTLGYNIINFPYREKGVEAAYKHNVPVVTMNPLGGGIIGRNSDYFKFLIKRPGETAVQAALRFNASHKGINVVLSGFNKLEEIDENIKAVENLTELTDEEISQIKENIRESLNELCTSCGYCMDCPKDLDIVEYMDLYNQYLLLGESPINEYAEFLKSKFKLESYISGIKSCINCKNCEGSCTQKLTITDRLAKLANMLSKFLVAK
ncbi:MAG: aldo/keto reductase [Lutispora sp.]|nr:aldo/keto reductase [Lutispora sp.]